MKNYNDLEKKLNQKFKGFEPTNDAESTWSAIEHKLPRKKKRRKFIFFWLLGLLVIGITTASYQTWTASKYDGITVSTNAEISLNLDDNIAQQQQNPITQNVALPLASALQLTKETSHIQEEAIGIKSITKPTINKHFATYDNESSATENKIEYQPSNSSFTVGEIQNSNSLGREDAFSNTTRLLVSYAETLKPNKIVIADYLDHPSRLMPIIEIPNTEKHRRQSLGIYTGLAISDIRHTTQNETFLDLSAARSGAEKHLYQASFGIEYCTNITSRFSISTGINYWISQWQSTHDTETSSIEQQGEYLVNTRTVNSRIRYGKDVSFAIPIRLNYSLWSQRQTQINIGVGYEFSIFGSHSGYEISSANQEYNIGTDPLSQYKNTSGNFLIGTVETAYDISPMWTIKLAAVGKYQMSNSQTAAAKVIRLHNFLGIRVGTSLNF